MILSPHGTRLVFVSEGQDGIQRLFTRRLDQPKAIQMPHTEGANEPFFSPDGQWVGFFAGGKLKKMPIDGGEESRLLADQGGAGWWNWALARNGIYFLDEGLNFFDFATGKRTGVYTSEKPLVMGLAVSPDGKSILYPQIDVAESSIMLLKNFR